MCHVIKTGNYVNLHCLTFHNMQTELNYHDYSSTSCILKRTRFLNRKYRKLGVSDDVMRKICKMVAVLEVSTYAKFHCNSTFVPIKSYIGGGGGGAAQNNNTIYFKHMYISMRFIRLILNYK